MLESFTHLGYTFHPLGQDGSYYCACSGKDSEGRRVEVEPRQCPRFPSRESACQWAEEWAGAADSNGNPPPR